MYLELKQLSFKYDQTSIIDNFDLIAEKGSITAIIGESGSGKSTLLRILAGLQNANQGVFYWMIKSFLIVNIQWIRINAESASSFKTTPFSHI